ncbi:MAG: ferritin-like domain-containing protein [Candidatus Gallimonas sp.]
MGLKADMEYPCLDGLEEDYAALRIISPAYAGRASELTAILQYVYQSIIFGNCGMEEAASTVEEIAVTEMYHFELLGTMICKLGAPPIFTSCPPYPVGYFSASVVDYSREPKRMLLSDLAGERAAVEQYERMAKSLCNRRVAEMILRIAEDEKVHVAALERLIDKMK